MSEGVFDRVKSNADAISRRAGGELRRLEDKILPAVMRSQLPREKKYFRLVEIQEKASSIIEPNTPCKSGCSSCCYMAVPITTFEADRIAEYVGRIPTKQSYLPSYLDRDGTHARLMYNADRRFMRVPCTFLGMEGDCTIYPVRPMPCRTHHVIEDNSEHCDLFTEVSGANQVDLSWIIEAATDLFISQVYADIREWFPTYEGG